MTTRLRLDMPFTDEQVEELVRLAIMHGYTRVEPRRRWTDRERREAARYAMERAVSEAVSRRGL